MGIEAFLPETRPGNRKTSLNLSEITFQRLEELCAELQRTKSEVIRAAIDMVYNDTFEE